MKTSTEKQQQRWTDWKERANDLYRELALMAHVAVVANDAGGLASVTVKSKRDIETWAAVGKQWNEDIDAAIEPESPLDVKWWAAVMDCPNPDEAREVAHHEQLGMTQIRKRYGVVKYRKPNPPAYNGLARVNRCADGWVTFRLDLAERPPELEVRDDVILAVWKRIK